MHLWAGLQVIPHLQPQLLVLYVLSCFCTFRLKKKKPCYIVASMTGPDKKYSTWIEVMTGCGEKYDQLNEKKEKKKHVGMQLSFEATTC